MAKRLEKQFKVMAPGGQATPAPPLGPALGAAGINPGQFVQQFNDRTKDLNGKVVGCLIRVYHDRSFDFEVKSSPASVLILEAAGGKVCNFDGCNFHLNEYLDGQKIDEHLLVAAPDSFVQVRDCLKPGP